MSLQDFIRETTIEINDALTSIEEKRNKLITDRYAADERIKRFGTEISAYKTREIECKDKLKKLNDNIRIINKEIEEIENKRRKYIEELTQCQDEIANSEKDKKTTEAKQIEINNKIKDNKREYDSYQRQLEEIEKERERIRSQEIFAKLRALKLYLEKVNNKIEEAFSGQEEQRSRFEALKSLKEARHVDPYIRELCEQRDEFQSILKKATVPGVITALQSELVKIENQLEARFPGALQAEAGGKISDKNNIEDLFYYCADNKYRILLPITPNIWKSIEEGNTGFKEELALRIAWCFAKSSGTIETKNDKFLLIDNFCYFEVHLDPQELEATMQLPGSSSLLFCLDKLPKDIEEALNNENPNS